MFACECELPVFLIHHFLLHLHPKSQPHAPESSAINMSSGEILCDLQVIVIDSGPAYGQDTCKQRLQPK